MATASKYRTLSISCITQILPASSSDKLTAFAALLEHAKTYSTENWLNKSSNLLPKMSSYLFKTLTSESANLWSTVDPTNLSKIAKMTSKWRIKNSKN